MNLTKTDFIAYLDAPKHLWAIKHNRLKKKEIDVFLNHLFEQGYNVEKYAEQYIKEILTKQYNPKDNDIVFQPTQEDGPFQARTDALILNPRTNKWDMYEIKSSSDISKQHKYDATFQYLVFSKEYEIGDIYILHLNKEYCRKGNINIEELFTATNITEDVKGLKDEVHELRYRALEDIQMEDHSEIESCIKPDKCPCIDLCHPNLPEYSIYDISGISGSKKKVRELESMDISSIYDIPKNFVLAPTYRRQVDVAQSKEVYIDKEYIQNDLEGVKYPIYFIDYESFNPAIPMYDGYKPYDQMPFQWSLHIQREKGGDLEHYEFIETEAIDPIPNFLAALKRKIEDTGSILVWNKSFEGKQNERMGEIHPEYKDFCENMNSRIYDLMDIFQKGRYADPKCKGSYSIKKILPALTTEIGYKGMSIGDGATAMTSWDRMVHGDLKENERKKIKNDLLKYCELDTLAMVEIYKYLTKTIN
jgi:hypothetical protein